MKSKTAAFISAQIRSFSVILFGDPQTVILEARVFNATLFLVFCACIVSEVENIFCVGKLVMHLLTILAIFLSMGAYLASRKMGIWKSLVLPVFLAFLGILSYFWIIQGGLSGSTVFYFFLLNCASIIVFQGLYKMLATILVCIFVLTLILIEVTHPAIIVPYVSSTQRYLDVSIILIVCLLTNSFIIYEIFQQYLIERTAKNLLLENAVREKEKVVQEKEKAEKAVIAKQRLLSMVSHDIANALFIVQGNASLLQTAGLHEPERQKDRIAGIVAGARNIHEIIDSVRMLQGIEEGVATLQLEQVRLDLMLARVQLLVSDRLQQKNLSLDIQLPGTEPCTILVEPRMFCNHVLSNLLSNAIKFSYPGSSIVISTGIREGFSTVSVADKGIGIPRGLKERLFLTGEKTSRKGTGDEPGTGLGLLVVKSFVNLFGGTIELLSRSEEEFPDDHGTTVTLYLKSA
jgi:signal transduction histidine kinase